MGLLIYLGVRDRISPCIQKQRHQSLLRVLPYLVLYPYNHADKIPAAAIAPIAPPRAAFLFATFL